MQMSRKAGLAKKIAHTLMAMSIVYSSGINIVVNEVYAAEKILLEKKKLSTAVSLRKAELPAMILVPAEALLMVKI